jgi:hypothetical protein
MVNLQDMVPAIYMAPEMKERLIEWLQASSLPRRFKRKLLQDWGTAVGVELAGADYEAVVKKGA